MASLDSMLKRREIILPTKVLVVKVSPGGFSGGPSGEEPTCQGRRCRDRGWIPGLRRSPGGGNGNLLQYSCLENPVDRGAWKGTVHSVTKSPKAQKTQLKQLSTYAHGFSSSHVWM